MKTILDMISAIDTVRSRGEVKFKHTDVTEQVSSFYDGIRSGSIKSDQDASQSLYGETPKDPRYRTFKYRQLDQLLNTIVTSSLSSTQYSGAAVSYFRCLKLTSSAILLSRLSHSVAATELARRAALIAEKYEFYDLAELNIQLLVNYAAHGRDTGSFRTATNRLNLVRERLQTQNTYTLLLDSLILGSLNINDQVKQQLKLAIQSLTIIVNNSDSFVNRLLLYRLRVLESEVYHDMNSLRFVSLEALDFYDSNPSHSTKSRLGEFNISLSYACSFLNLHDQSSSLALTAVSQFESGGFNWFVSMEMAIIASIRSGSYSQAHQYYQAVTAHVRFDQLPDFHREKWTVYYTFIVIASRLSLYQDADESEIPFRLGTFMNSIDSVAREKQGANFQVLIIQLTFMVLFEKYDDVTSRLDYMRVYIFRYLRDEVFSRDKELVRIFSNLAACSFNPKVFRARHSDLIQRMYEPLDPTQPISTNELIHYGLLIDRLLDTLERRSS